ncbi:MAG: hypothetical protein ABI776_09540 [Nocardioidaceae bacterium]
MTTETTRTTERRLSPALLVGGTFALTTLFTVAFHVGEILFTDHDPHAPQGPIATIESVTVLGGVGLLLALVIAVPLVHDPHRAKVGAIVLGALSIVTLPVFWSGAPATLGASAAWLGGFARGSHPQSGAARGFGVVGVVIAVLTIVASVFGGAAAQLLR